MSSPRLAVVTPTFNRPNGVRRLLRSLREQNQIVDWTLVVVDDCSTERAPEDVVGDPAVVVHRNSQNAGPLVSRNRGLEIALRDGADLIAFVDDDDYLAPGFFEYILRIWAEQREIGWFVSRCRFVGPVPHSEDRWPAADGLFDYFDHMQLDRVFVSDVMHIVAADRVQSVRFSERGRRQREWTFLARLAKGGPFYASRDITKIVEYGSSGLTASRSGPAPDLLTCFDYTIKAAVILGARPLSLAAWKRFWRQTLLLPVRLAILSTSALRRSMIRGS